MIRFTYDSTSIDLPNPILGNSEQLDLITKFEFSMSREVHSSRKTTTHSKLLLGFDNLTATEMASFKTFLIGARGKSVTYKDYNDVSWVGALLGDPFEFTHIGSNECAEMWSINIEFEAINT